MHVTFARARRTPVAGGSAALLAPGTQVAGVFTKSRTASAPVLWCQDKLKGGEARVTVPTGRTLDV
jgi:N-acetylglutamate synthase/N-acetylornithine aminotransferase